MPFMLHKDAAFHATIIAEGIFMTNVTNEKKNITSCQAG
jgi:hypothetical protein